MPDFEVLPVGGDNANLITLDADNDRAKDDLITRLKLVPHG